ncbi:tetratricopeptide repeat protein [Candidatus Albibeggiatoa sp. nov. NOAA]|uniref:WD40 domain-containing protein n=1 Tax=Candidatus Albibeggiatoa sp. nov. NOAA TaxID=3162724 RepID=UPI003300106D|nr:tetratricopeptide repeat protein [Thiotrichaceae bacterium]
MFIRKRWLLFSYLFFYLIAHAHGETCTANQCDYKLNLNKTGSYVAKVALDETGQAGIWGLSVLPNADSSLQISKQGFGIGTYLLSNNASRSWTNFYVSQPQAIQLTLFNHNDATKPIQITVERLQQDQYVPVGNAIDLISEQTYTTEVLETGYYTVTMLNNDASAAYAGLLIQSEDMSCCTTGGWIEPNNNQVGYIYFNLAEAGKVQFSTYFSMHYGEYGASQPILELDYIDAQGVTKTVWTSSDTAQISPTPELDAFIQQGQQQVRTEQYEQAINSYEQALAIDPEYVAAWEAQGDLFNFEGLSDAAQYEQALANYDKALALQPDAAQIWFKRGHVLSYLGLYDDAITSYQQAAQLQPSQALFQQQYEQAQLTLKQPTPTLPTPANATHHTLTTQSPAVIDLNHLEFLGNEWLMTNQPFDSNFLFNIKTGDIHYFKSLLKASSDAQYATYIDQNDNVQLLDLKKNTLLNNLIDKPLDLFETSPDESKLVFAYKDGSVELWDGQTHTQLQTQGDPIQFMQFSADSKLLAVHSSRQDGLYTMTFWNAETQQKLSEARDVEIKTNDYYGPQGGQFSPDGRIFVSMMGSSLAIIWEVATGKILGKIGGGRYFGFPLFVPHTYITFSPDGQHLMLSYYDGTFVYKVHQYIGMYQDDEYQIYRIPESISGRMNALNEFISIPDGQFALYRLCKVTTFSVTNDCSLVFGNLITGKLHSDLQIDGRYINYSEPFLIYKPNDSSSDDILHIKDIVNKTDSQQLEGKYILDYKGKLLYSTEQEEIQTLHLWDMAQTQEIAQTDGYYLQQEENILIYADPEHGLHLADLSTGTEIVYLQGHTMEVVSVELYDDYLISTSDKEMIIWDITTGQKAYELNPTSSRYLIFDNQFFIYKTYEGEYKSHVTIRVVDLKTSEVWRSIKNASNKYLTPRFVLSANEKTLAYIQDKQLYVWDVATNQITSLFKPLDPEFAQSSSQVALHPQQSILAVSSAEFIKDKQFDDNVKIINNARLWDITTGEALKQLNRGKTYALAWHPTQLLLAYTNAEKRITLWDIATDTHTLLPNQQRNAYAMTWSPDGKLIAGTSDDNIVQIWHVNTGAALSQLVHQTPIKKLLWSASGESLITATTNTIHFWDMTVGTELNSILAHDGIKAITFNFDESILASLGQDGLIRLWDIETGLEISRLNDEQLITSMALHPQQNLLVYGTQAGSIKLYDLLTSQYVGYLTQSDLPITDVLFSSNGETLIVNAENGEGTQALQTWRVSDLIQQ